MADKIIDYTSENSGRGRQLYNKNWYKNRSSSQTNYFNFDFKIYMKEQNLTQKTITLYFRWEVRTVYSGATWNVSNVWTSIWLTNNTEGTSEVQIGSGDRSKLTSAYTWTLACDATKTLNYVDNGLGYGELNIGTRCYWNNTSGANYACYSFSQIMDDLDCPEIQLSIRVPLKIGDSMVDSVPYVLVNGEWKESKPYILVGSEFKEVVSS
jgi:hypothetical protein